LVECEACKEYLPFSTLASHQLDDCSFRQTLPKIAPGMPPMFNLWISQGLLDCTYCHRALLPDSYGGRAFTVGEI
jgi:hypothetical protein